MTDMEQRTAARDFAAYWQNRGDEKQGTQTFWLTLLQKVLGVEDADKLIAFEVPVKLDHAKSIAETKNRKKARSKRYGKIYR